MPPARPRHSGSVHQGVSVIIPCEPESGAQEALSALAALPSRERALIADVRVAWGLNPGRQRNLAAFQAPGDWLWFLDKDSRPEAGCLAALWAAGQAGAAAVGGPNLALPDESGAGLRFDAVLGSWFGSMASRARYRAVGAPRACSEKELIGCNLLVRRDAFWKAGGFREDLYPNEENEFLERLKAGGAALRYEPGAAVRRGRRGSVGAFAAQAYAYGRGRARQARVAWTRGSLLNFLPLLLPLAWLACAPVFAVGNRGLACVPPLGYALACLIASRGKPIMGLFALRHHAYAAGLLAGLFLPRAVLPRDVRIRGYTRGFGGQVRS